MEQFFKSVAYRIRDAMRAGDRLELEIQLDFCKAWGPPLALLAMVVEVHLELMEQVSAPPADQPIPPAAPAPEVQQSSLLELLRERRAAC